MTAAEARDACAFAIGSDTPTLTRVPGLSKRRAGGLPAAALVLERLIERGGFEEVVISAFGVREGLVFEGLDAAERAGDPLLAGIEASLRGAGSGRAFWRALEDWLVPLAAEIGPVFGPARDPLLRAAAARLADIAARRLPDQRAAVAFAETLAAPIVGLAHAERVFLAAVAHHRYAGPAEPVDPAGALALLSEPRRVAAQRLGLGLRLACDLAARSADLLGATRLELTPATLDLRLDPKVAVLYDDTARKRLDHLAIAVGRQARVVSVG
jgi:exopolyphosphatase/guanosine-5'-triphosphate,3'-diphosphate pyrophosphatase